jgi:cysteine desulfurase
MSVIYLDHISSNPLHPQVKEAIIDYLQQDGFGNPSSQHRIGDGAVERLEAARSSVARLVNAKPEEIVFTSGGTESNNNAIKGVAFALADKGKHVVTSNIEHTSVSRTVRTLMKLGYQVTSVPVDGYGLVDPADVEKAIRDDTILVSIMHANNEIGTVEPIAEIGRITRSKNVLFHTDAIASCGNIPVDVEELGADLLSLAANQFYGPSGTGALYVRENTRIVPIMEGGIQENNRRAGTPNMLGIVGMGKAAELAKAEMFERMQHLFTLRKALLDRVATIDEVFVNGHPEKCLPGLISLSVKYIEGESMLIMLDEEGVTVSTRSACAAGSLRASHVLIAAGRDYADAQGTLVFSLGAENTIEEVESAFEALKRSVTFLREMSPLYKKK